MNGRSFRRGVSFVVVAWFDKGRYPIMDRCHKFVGFTSENGRGVGSHLSVFGFFQMTAMPNSSCLGITNSDFGFFSPCDPLASRFGRKRLFC